jgi:hypothetical protein
MTTPVPDTEGVSGNPGAASLGTQRIVGNAETATPAGAGYGGGPTGLVPNPNTAASGTPDTTGAGTSANVNFTPVSTALSGTNDTQLLGWPQTTGVSQAYRAPNTVVGALGGAGALDTTRTDSPITNGSARPDLMSIYTGTLESALIGAPTGPVGTGVPVAPAAPTVTAGDGSVKVNWVAVADPANALVRGYIIQNNTLGTMYATRADSSVVFDTVVPDVQYTFKVAARNDAGLGPFSPASAAVSAYNAEEVDVNEPGGLRPYGAINPIYNPDGTAKVGSGTAGTPGAPTGVVETAGAVGVLNVAWVAPTTGGRVVSYTVTLSSGQSKSIAAGTLTAQFTGLTSTTPTTARVTAVGTVFNTQSAASASVNVP